MPDSLFSLNGQVAVITGSSRGIGKAIALRMAQQGAEVVVSGRKSEACDAAVADIESRRTAQWGHAHAEPANVSRPEDVQRLIANTVQRFGRIDILVCNAATNLHVGPSLELSEAVLRKVSETNLMSLYWLTQAVLPGMRERQHGRIIFIASLAAVLGSGASLSYAMTKAAGIQAMRTLAVEFGSANIRCNSIAPGVVRTDMTRAMMDQPELMRAYLDRSPAGVVAEADQIAGAAVFLAAPAGAQVNGQTLVIDGGYSLA